MRKVLRSLPAAVAALVLFYSAAMANMPGTFTSFIRAASSSGAWTTVATNSGLGNNAGSSGWNGYTLTQFIPQSSLAATGGTLVRVTYQTNATAGLSLSAAYICQASASYSSSAPACASTNTQITFAGGSAGFSVASGASPTLSDTIAFVMPSSNGIVLSHQFNAASTITTSVSTPTGWVQAYKLGADAATAAKTGYALQAQNGGLIALVEEFI